MNAKVKNQLDDGEYILWQGRPENPLLSAFDILIEPFGILWSVIAWGGAYTALTSGSTFFSPFMLPFVIVGLYLVFGRYIYKLIIKKNTYYFVTDKRIIFYKTLLRDTMTSIYYPQIPCLEMKKKENGYGTIWFGVRFGIYGIFENTGLDFMIPKNDEYKWPPAFLNIVDVDEVYNKIEKKFAETEYIESDYQKLILR